MSARALLAALPLALLACPARAQDETSKLFERPWVIGASLSAGFGLSCNLGDALTATLAGEHGPVHADATELFFTNPRLFAGKQLEAVFDGEPTLVVALDFLFWFGYGTANAAGAPIASEDERLGLLEVGLDLLDELECPLVLGDFPDMSAAIGKMLSKEQVPAPATLARLSDRVRAWAAERGDTIVVPLAGLVSELAKGQSPRLGKYDFPEGTVYLQSDQLQPTLEGLKGVTLVLAEQLVGAILAREAQFTFDLAAVRSNLGPCARPRPRIQVR